MGNKTSVLYLDHFNKHGGAQEYILDIINHLPDEWEAFYPSIGIHSLASKLNKGTDLGFKLLSKQWWHPFFSFKFLQNILQIKLSNKRHWFNLIHCNSIPALILTKFCLLGLPVVFTCHDISLKQFHLFWINWIPVRIIAVSHFVEKFLLSRGIDKKKITVIYNAVPDQKTTKPFVTTGEVRIGIATRIVPWKGVELFLEAAESLLKTLPQCRFIVFGNSPSKRYESDLKNRFSNPKITFTSQRQEKVEIFQTLDILVNSSIEPEPFGRTLVEAGVFSLPCIGPNLAGPAEIIDDGQTGLLFEPGNQEDLRRKLALLIENTDLRVKLGQQNRRRFERLFHPNVILPQITSLYAETVKNFQN